MPEISKWPLSRKKRATLSTRSAHLQWYGGGGVGNDHDCGCWIEVPSYSVATPRLTMGRPTRTRAVSPIFPRERLEHRASHKRPRLGSAAMPLNQRASLWGSQSERSGREGQGYVDRTRVSWGSGDADRVDVFVDRDRHEDFT